MKRSFVLIAVALLLVALISGAYALYDVLGNSYTGSVTAPPSVSQSGRDMAPDFTVLDGNGNEVKLSDFSGIPVVLNFWATWCGPCRNELPDFDAMAKEFQGQTAFMMVNLTDGYSETVASVSKFVTENGYTFPVYFDTKSEAAYAYGVNAVPATYFIGADGTIVSYHIGMIDGASLRQGIENLGGVSGAAGGVSAAVTVKVGTGALIAAAVSVLSLCGSAAALVVGMVQGKAEKKRAAARMSSSYMRNGYDTRTSGMRSYGSGDYRGGSVRGDDRGYGSGNGRTGSGSYSDGNRSGPTRGQ